MSAKKQIVAFYGTEDQIKEILKAAVGSYVWLQDFDDSRPELSFRLFGETVWRAFLNAFKAESK